MCVVKAHQMTLGEFDISQIQFDLKSRDDIPHILRGLQHLYLNESLRKSVFELLEQDFQPKVSKQVGRPGMGLWTILVLGVIRLDLNADYDRMLELANQHLTLRQLLGHSDYDNPQYQYQTLVDNVRLFTPELLGKINTLVVKEGHVLVKKGDAALRKKQFHYLNATRYGSGKECRCCC